MSAPLVRSLAARAAKALRARVCPLSSLPEFLPPASSSAGVFTAPLSAAHVHVAATDDAAHVMLGHPPSVSEMVQGTSLEQNFEDPGMVAAAAAAVARGKGSAVAVVSSGPAVGFDFRRFDDKEDGVKLFGVGSKKILPDAESGMPLEFGLT